MRKGSFAWPNGKCGAVSLTFDDGRESQVMVGIPLLNRYGIKATFYVVPSWAKSRLSEWREAVAVGHEIGNHTIHHPGTKNLPWARQRALEDYTLARIANELDVADVVLERMFGVRPISFAYTCGMTFVGRGENAESYVPLVAKRFIAGRGWRDECANNPSFCDLAYVMGMELDGLNSKQIKTLVRRTAKDGSWLVLCGHEIGSGGPQTTLLDTLTAFCEHAKDPKNGLWVAPVAEIASYIASQRLSDYGTRDPVSTHPGLIDMINADAKLVVCILRAWGLRLLRTLNPPRNKRRP